MGKASGHRPVESSLACPGDKGHKKRAFPPDLIPVSHTSQELLGLLYRLGKGGPEADGNLCKQPSVNQD